MRSRNFSPLLLRVKVWRTDVEYRRYAMFFMNDKALQQLDAAKGFEVGPTSQQF